MNDSVVADGPAATAAPATSGSRAHASGRATLPLLPAVLLSLASGAVLALAFPGSDLWMLAPVGVAGLAVAARGQRSRRGALLGLVAGLAFFVPHLSWAGAFVGALPWLALALLEAGFFAALGALLPLAWRAPGGRAGTVLAVAGLWVAQEALRGRLPFGGFPWGRLGFSQASAPTLGWAALGGVPLVGFVVAAAGACLAVAAVAVIGRGRAVAVVAPVVAAAALLAGGLAVPLPGAEPADRSVQVAAVQGNVPTAGLDFNAQRRAVLDNHARATRELARAVEAGSTPRPDVVLWPENASDVDPLRNDDARAVVQQAADAVGVPVLVGAVLDEPEGFLSNAGIVWGPSTGDGAPAGPGARYVKRHPAPFGEYIPYRSFFRLFSDKVDLVRRDFAPGSAVGVLPAGPARLGNVICFEVAYDGLVRDPVLAGADLLVVQTNNATFGYTDESVQQLAMSRLRAVETGRAVVHVSTVGESGLIRPDGSFAQRSGLFTQEVLRASLPLRTELTPAVRLGPWPELVLAGLGVALVAGTALTSAVPVIPRRGRRDRAGGTRQDGPAPTLPAPSPAGDTEGDR